MNKIVLSSEYELLIDSNKNNQDSSAYIMEPVHLNEPLIFLGVDIIDNKRRVYIDITVEKWESNQINSFPSWKGIKIEQKYYKNIGPLSDVTFLIISQTEEKTSEIFEFILQSIVDKLTLNKFESLYMTIYEELDRWHNFFKKYKNKRLSLIEEMGIFGELHFIKKWIENNVNQVPLIINNWKGPLNYRLDFLNAKKGIEIKTIDNNKKRNEIVISSEKQLELTKGVNNIQLYVLNLSIVEGKGLTIKVLIDTIEEFLIDKYPSLINRFKALLMEVEYSILDSNFDMQEFFVENENAYQVIEKFPKLVSKDLPLGVTNVAYTIDLSHCEKFKIDTIEIFK